VGEVTERVLKVKQEIKKTFWGYDDQDQELNSTDFSKVRLSLLPGIVDPK
jgi:hypothetical protein